VEEEKLRQPHFFTSGLPNECVRALMDQERFGSINDGSAVSGDLRMVIETAVRKIPVVLRARENEPGWDVLDGRQQQRVASLSPEMTAHLTALQGFARGLFGN